MKLPTHICLYLNHNPHRGNSETIERWVRNYLAHEAAHGTPPEEAIHPDDRAAILASGEVWVLSWCPETPVGSCEVVAATLERALELASDDEAS